MPHVTWPHAEGAILSNHRPWHASWIMYAEQQRASPRWLTLASATCICATALTRCVCDTISSCDVSFSCPCPTMGHPSHVRSEPHAATIALVHTKPTVPRGGEGTLACGEARQTWSTSPQPLAPQHVCTTATKRAQHEHVSAFTTNGAPQSDKGTQPCG